MSIFSNFHETSILNMYIFCILIDCIAAKGHKPITYYIFLQTLNNASATFAKYLSKLKCYRELDVPEAV